MDATLASNSSDPNCIFCKIVASQIPCQKIYEDERVIAIHDVQPQAPVHALVIPKHHFANVMAVRENQLIGLLFKQAAQCADTLGLNKGFRLVVNTGEEGGQTVDHLHIHVLGGRHMTWPPG